MNEAWSNSFKLKVHELTGFLECAKSVPTAASSECLHLLQDLLRLAVIVLTRSKYRMAEIQLIAEADASITSLSVYSGHKERKSLPALKEAQILVKNLYQDFHVIKTEPVDDIESEEGALGSEELRVQPSIIEMLRSVQRKLLMTSYNCFLCANLTEFKSERDLAMHVQVSHMQKHKNGGHVLDCLHCKKTYTFARRSFTESVVSEMLVFLYQHLLNDHSALFSSADFVLPVLCPMQCGVVRYSISSVRKHLTQVHKKSMSDVEAVDAFSQLLTLAKCPLSAKRKSDAEHPKRKRSKRTDEEVGSEFHAPFSLSRSAENALCVIEDYALHMSRNCCFLCSDRLFDSSRALRDHWSDAHFSNTRPHRFIQCPYCDARYKVLSAKSSRFHVAQVMSHLSFHLVTAHSDVFTLPEYVHRMECPFPGCSALHFQLHTLRKHMPAHEIRSNIRQLQASAYLVPHDGTTQAKFTRYVCFVCSDQEEEVEFASIMDYMNHWFADHITLCHPFATSACPICEAVCSVQIPKSGLREAGRLMQLISELLLHMVSHHIDQPPYVESLPTGSDSEEDFDPPLVHLIPGTFVSSQLPKPTNREMMLERYGGFHERSLCLTELRCFHCGENSDLFSTETELMNHWSRYHMASSGSSKVIRCALCSHLYRLPKLVASSFFESLGFYCLHLARNHAAALPSFVVQFACPVFHCEFFTFSMHSLRRHLCTHGVEALTFDLLEKGNLPLTAGPTVAEFRSYQCFLCSDGVEYESAFFLVNHWLQSHFEVSHKLCKYVCRLNCPHCDHSEISVNKKIMFTGILEKLSALLAHLILQHDLALPDYVTEFACPEDGCGHVDVSACLLDRHASSVHAADSLASLQTGSSPSLQYTEYRCVECGEESCDFECVQDLSKHWIEKHMEASDGLLVLQCKQCHKQFTHKCLRPNPQPANLQALVARYLTHLVKQHQFSVPECLVQFKCKHYGCDFTSFIPKHLTAHLKEGHTAEIEETDPAPVTKDEFRPKDLLLDPFGCFLCDSNEDFGCRAGLVSHVVSTHCVDTPKGPVIQCPHCYKRLKVYKQSVRKVFDIIGALLIHMSEKHLFEAPQFISRFPCSQDGCAFFTFTADHLATHLKAAHGVINEQCALQKPKNFFNTNKARQNLTSKLIMKMKQYFCFLCVDGKEYQTIVEYAQHWRERHLVQTEDVFVLKCMHCSTVYRIPLKKGLECSGVFERATNLFMHLVSKHDMYPPDYIVPYRCEAKSCSYVTYTLYKLETHCKAFHNVTHASLVEAAEKSKELNSAVNACHEVASFMCFKCGAEFSSLAEKEQHTSEHHGAASQFLCHVCSRGFRAIESYHMHLFREHSIESDGFKGLYCDQCDFSTVFANKLASHLYNVHGIVSTSVGQ
ncbi:hypothetical protein CAPTEDRAFT_190720 [Capitella teleta]|uniref:C2H2-type domain-containing protein n=1 Tax=Capitella teleta TaxID=283909 RepID=R7TS43_CAPTE|nr:hypothetical protein CAPTEDRAFT_190720 [Capitella teleta]|eukprot:ELT96474.1 hypothetical protein CAPTEDRAFT_190720 [Capitella teleta]